MTDLERRLLELAVRLELGGTVSGEEAAATIREALERVGKGETDADQVQSLRLAGVL